MAVPRIHKEVSIFDPENTIAGGIEDAGKANSFVTEITGGGVMVHPSGDDTSGWRIAAAFELLKSGVSYIKMWLDGTTAKLRLGRGDSDHILLGDGIDIRSGQTRSAWFGANGFVSGSSAGQRLVGSPSELNLYSDVLASAFKVGTDESSIPQVHVFAEDVASGESKTQFVYAESASPTCPITSMTVDGVPVTVAYRGYTAVYHELPDGSTFTMYRHTCCRAIKDTSKPDIEWEPVPIAGPAAVAVKYTVPGEKAVLARIGYADGPRVELRNGKIGLYDQDGPCAELMGGGNVLTAGHVQDMSGNQRYANYSHNHDAATTLTALKDVAATKTAYSTASALANVVTAGSGITVSNVWVARWGRLMTIQIRFTKSSATAANALVTVCTLKSGFIPAYTVGGGNATWLGQVGNDGVVYARNMTGASVAAGMQGNIGFTFVMA